MYLHMRKSFRHNQPVITHQCLSRGADSLLPICGQGNIGGACVLARKRPFGLAMSDYETTRGSHGNLARTGVEKRTEEIQEGEMRFYDKRKR